MKKRFLIFVLIILIILLILFCIIKPKRSIKPNTNQTSRNFILKNNENSNINTNGENSGIFVGINNNGNENYIFISIKIDKSSSKEAQVKSLISEIGNAIGYKIDINSIGINENTIKVDLAKTAAPFDLENSILETENKTYFIASTNAVAKTIFDSINKTLKYYFGTSTEIYFSADSENIDLSNEIITLEIDSSKSYENK